MDNKELRSREDRDRVDANDINEVTYIHEQFPELEREQIIEAIKERGPIRKNVIDYLKETFRV